MSDWIMDLIKEAQAAQAAREAEQLRQQAEAQARAEQEACDALQAYAGRIFGDDLVTGLAMNVRYYANWHKPIAAFFWAGVELWLVPGDRDSYPPWRLHVLFGYPHPQIDCSDRSGRTVREWLLIQLGRIQEQVEAQERANRAADRLIQIQEETARAASLLPSTSEPDQPATSPIVLRLCPEAERYG